MANTNDIRYDNLIENLHKLFNNKEVEIQCPECDDIYHISEKELHDSVTNCWRCGTLYLQKLHKTSNIKFVRKAVHRVKGEK